MTSEASVDKAEKVKRTPQNPAPSPLKVISRMVASSQLSGTRRTVESRLAFYVLHSTLQVFYLFISAIHMVISMFRHLKLRILMMFYHHNRTPQLIRSDVSQLAKIPGHVAAILNLREHEEGGGIDGVLDEAGELAAWSTGAGIKTLTLYERTGVLKYLPRDKVYNAIASKLDAYFGNNDRPRFSIRVPRTGGTYVNGVANGPGSSDGELTINLLSEEDGRETIVELTRTLADLAVHKKIRPEDVTVEVIDEEMKDLVTGEPDLLVLFTPVIDLQGFPPWQIRLTEIFHQPDNREVSYTVFLKALQRYSTCKINVGR